MKKVYVLPNLFTTASLFCGMIALTHIFQDQLIEACWFILASAVLDAFDGKVARWTKSESSFGVNYDSLSDLVAFGVAPAALMFAVLSTEVNVKIASGVTTLFAICGALRLARFNVQRTKEEKKAFTGLPIPAAAGMVVSSFLVYNSIDGSLSEIAAKVLPFIIVMLSGLMVSNIPYPSHKNLDFGRKSFDYLVSVILAIAVIASLFEYKQYLLFLAFLAYATFGVARALLKLWQHLMTDEEALEEHADPEPVPIKR